MYTIVASQVGMCPWALTKVVQPEATTRNTPLLIAPRPKPSIFKHANRQRTVMHIIAVHSAALGNSDNPNQEASCLLQGVAADESLHQGSCLQHHKIVLNFCLRTLRIVALVCGRCPQNITEEQSDDTGGERRAVRGLSWRKERVVQWQKGLEADLEPSTLDKLEGEYCSSLLSKSMTHGWHAAWCDTSDILHQQTAV